MTRQDTKRKSVKALVDPRMLIWARESAGYTLNEVATTAGLSKSRDWESGKVQPTIAQLRTLANKYKRPLAAFYLPEPPADFPAIADFRRQAGSRMQRMSPTLHLQIRAARERREIALDMLEELGEDIPEISIQANLDEDPETVGVKIREYLRITHDEQRSWRDDRMAFNGWRRLIEDKGVLVFQMDKVDRTEASGFAISEAQLPAIAVNRADAYSRRTFSLLHEFAHLPLSKSGVSESQVDVARPPETQQVEVWCNAAAAVTLLPRDVFLSQAVIQAHETGKTEWSDDIVENLASTFKTSRTAIVRRLLTLGLTDRKFYLSKERLYSAQYAESFEHKRMSDSKRKFGGRDMSREALSLLGHNFIRMVLATYHSERITMRDVSEYLNLKIRHIPKIEQALLRERAH